MLAQARSLIRLAVVLSLLGAAAYTTPPPAQASPACILCPAVVPQCRPDCISCLIIPQTCERCARAICPQ